MENPRCPLCGTDKTSGTRASSPRQLLTEVCVAVPNPRISDCQPSTRPASSQCFINNQRDGDLTAPFISADQLVLRHYGKILKRHLTDEPTQLRESVPPTQPNTTKSATKWLAISLIALSFACYGGLAIVPFSALSVRGKAALSTALIIVGEASFWIGGLMLGKEVLARYRKHLNPFNWFRRRP